MNITQTLEKWGNSQGVRLPKKVLEAARLRRDSRLAISLRGRSIVLTPINDDGSLDTMLADVTPQAVGGEFNLGSDVGAERIS